MFGTGQPTKEGFQNGLKHIFSECGADKVLWTNMRQEPVVYLNGQSFTPRLSDKLGWTNIKLEVIVRLSQDE